MPFKSNIYKKLFGFSVILFTLFISSNSYSQSVDELSDDQIQQFMKQAQESGMSEEQLMAAAATKGFTASDIVKFKERITKLQSDKKSVGATNSTNTERKVNDTLAVEKKTPRELKKEDSIATRREKIFGLSLFNNKKLSFEPNLRIPTPKNYILGVDDELSISITGFAYKNYTAKISPEGTVQIENLSPIYVNGLTIEQARERIVNRLKTLYAGLSTSGGGLSADVTLGNIRSIKVTVIGEAVQPGTYTVPSLATVFNVLYACGGPSEIGSLRNIEVFRAGKVIRTLDFYDLLLKGDSRDNILLNDQDIIRIPYVDVRVVLNGEVRNPKIYELKKGETLKEVLSFAGGFSEEAYSKNLTIRRVTPIEKKIITVDNAELPTFMPQKGDIIEVRRITNKYENLIHIKGAVYRTGDYELENGLTISQLIKKAEGLRDEAFKNRILIKRSKENYDPEIISIDFEKIMKGENEDIKLVRQDTIIVKSFEELREKRTIIVDGAVNKTGSYPYTDNLSVSEAIALAGGFSDGAEAANIEIARRIKEDSLGLPKEQSVRIFYVKVNRDLTLNAEDSKFVLKPFDRIYIRRLARYEEQKNVSISGEVFYPGPYALKDKTERISDLIVKAGGLKSEADLTGARFIRSGKVIGLDLTKIKADRENPNNLLLASGDALDIPRKKETVTITGQVYNPISVPYHSELNLKDYINLAGGTTDSAFVKKIYVKYANGNLDRTRSFLGIRKYPKIGNGSEIYVPVRRRTKWTPAERIAVSSALVSIATILVTVLRLGSGN